jgi:clan AA aspartic protease (TIGR02281 family)
MTQQIKKNRIIKKTIFLLIALFSSLLGNTQSYNFDQGVKAYKEGNIEKSLDYFGREINDNPKAALSLYYRAVIYNYQDQNSLALRDINNSIKFFSSKEKAMLSGAHRLRGSIYCKIDNYEKAFEDYAIALKLSPADPEIYIERAQIYFDLKLYTQAEADYRQALKIDESLVMPYAGLGRNYINQKKYSEAEKVLNQLIKLAPNYADGYKFKARAYFEQKKYDEAIEVIFYCFLLDEKDKGIRSMFVTYSEKNYSLAFSKVNAQISSNPEKDLWYFVRAQLFEGKYNFRAAISDYTKLMELADIDYKSNLLSYRAKCYSKAGMYEQAIADYTDAISIDSTDAFYYGYRGDVKRLMGNYIGAKEDFTKAIAVEPRESWFYYRRGWIEEEFLKNNEAGLNDYNEAISLSKEYAYTYLHRGRLYEVKLKNPTKAKEDYTKILALDTIILEAGNCRQYALFHLGREDEAIMWLNKIIEQYPIEGNFYDATCLYSLMNKPQEALDNMQLAFENGYRDFNHLADDDDLDNIRNLPEFKSLVAEWKNVFDESLKKDLVVKKEEAKVETQTVSIPMKVSEGGTYEVPCKINELKLNLIFDTGASDITISKTEAQFMLKNDYLSNNDITGTSSYMIANGDIEVGTTIIFRKVDFGGLVLKNVKATVIENKNAPLLFGQSALSKYGKITIDNEKKIITISVKSGN